MLTGGCAPASRSIAVHTWYGVDFHDVFNLINFMEIAPTCEVKPALWTSAKLGPQFAIEISRLGAWFASQHQVLGCHFITMSDKTTFLIDLIMQPAVGQRVVEVENGCKYSSAAEAGFQQSWVAAHPS